MHSDEERQKENKRSKKKLMGHISRRKKDKRGQTKKLRQMKEEYKALTNLYTAYNLQTFQWTERLVIQILSFIL